MAARAQSEAKLWHVSLYIVLPSLIFLFTFLFFLACKLKVDNFDTFSIFLNAKAVAGPSEFFYRDRPALLPALLAPFFLLEPVLGIPEFAVMASRSLNVFFFALFLAYLYKLLRLSMNGWAALWGVFFAALNPLLIHYAPFVKEDVPGAALSTAALYYYLRQSSTGTMGQLIAAGAFTGLAIAMRHQLIAIFFLLFAVDMVLTKPFQPKFFLKLFFRLDRQWIRRVLFLFGMPTLLFLLLPAFVNAAAGRCQWWEGVSVFLADRLWQAERFGEISVSVMVSFNEACQLLMACLPWPLWGMFVLGLWRTWQTHQRLFYFLFGFLFLNFAFQAFVLLHNEARYFFPVFPVLYFFSISGVFYLAERGVVWLKRLRVLTSKEACFIGLAIVLSVIPLKNAASEMLKFSDPVYLIPFQKNVCEAASRIAGSRSIYWVGSMYNLYPKDYQFHPLDPYTYMYHVYNHTCQFYAGRKVGVYNEYEPMVVSLKDPTVGLFVPQVGNGVIDGDVLIVNADKAHDALTLETKRDPLVIQKVRRVYFEHRQTDEKSGEQVFFADRAPKARITVKKSGNVFFISGTGLRDGIYEIYAFAPKVTSYTKSWGLIQVTEGATKFMYNNTAAPVPSIDEIVLLYYTDVQKVNFPGVSSDEK